MNKKISLGAAVSFMFIIAVAVFSVTWIYAQSTFQRSVNNLKQRELEYEKFTQIEGLVRENYIGTVNDTALMDSVAQGYINGIGDKYARYISAEENAKLTALNTEGEAVGIGVTTAVSPEGYLLVTEVVADSPAQVAGIIANDLIVNMDDIDIIEENAADMQGMIPGRQGTTIKLVVRRQGEEFTVDMPRRAVAAPTVYSQIIADSDIGYILIKEFASNTSDQFNRELDKIIKGGAKSIIFDVRDNKSGNLRQASRIIDRLVPAGIIYTAQRKYGDPDVVTSDGNRIDMPMAVIVNAGTSNAAEIFAQSLKDFNKARIIGTVTAGKGVLQEILPMPDGSAIELTVAKLTPGLSPSFDGVGIHPDFEVLLEEDWTKLEAEADPQIRKAMEVASAISKAQTNQAESQAEEDSLDEGQENSGTAQAAS